MTAALEGPHVSAADVVEFFGQLERGHFYGARDGYPAAAARDLVADIARWTADSLPDPHDAHASEQFACRLERTRRRAPSVHIGREVRRVVLAADRLVDPYNQISGIARYGWELVGGLDDDAGVELHVLLREPSVG